MLSNHDDEVWKNKFHSCFKSIKDNSITWFQYRIFLAFYQLDIFLEKLNCQRMICVFCKDQK